MTEQGPLVHEGASAAPRAGAEPDDREAHRSQAELLPLFREEALRSRARRLDGEVVALHILRHWILIGGLGAAVLVLAIWAAATGYAETVVVKGVVLPDRPLAEVYAARAGTVREVFVSEGDSVEKGAVLASIATEIDPDAPISTAGQIAMLARRNEQMANEQVALETARSGSETRELEAAIASFDEQRDRIDAQISYQERLVVSTNSLLESMRPVLERGYVAKAEYERRRAEALRNQKDLEELRGRRAAITADLSKARIALANAPNTERQREASLTRDVLNAKVNRLNAVASQDYLVRAPTAGRINNLRLTPGARADTAAPAMTIVPAAGAMTFTAFAPSRSVGMVRAGQRAQIRIDAFPYRRFGSVSGSVESVSRSVILPGEVAEPVRLQEPSYRIRIRLDRAQVQADSGPIPLQPGMAGDASILLERRSLLNWLLIR
ncbi:MAG: rane fusion protein [Sphingomonadales bacterium]|nr:rane fusion protein [Sphingomonadales bacterium]